MSWGIVGSRWPEIKATAAALHTYGLIELLQKHVLGDRKLSFVSPHSLNEHTTALEDKG